jgi:hypothetical protein
MRSILTEKAAVLRTHLVLAVRQAFTTDLEELANMVFPAVASPRFCKFTRSSSRRTRVRLRTSCLPWRMLCVQTKPL